MMQNTGQKLEKIVDQTNKIDVTKKYIKSDKMKYYININQGKAVPL